MTKLTEYELLADEYSPQSELTYVAEVPIVEYSDLIHVLRT